MCLGLLRKYVGMYYENLSEGEKSIETDISSTDADESDSKLDP
jgi:hypothetical protein